jgi:hypothetical protein
MLSYGGDAKQSQLTSGLFYKDDAGRMDAVLLEGAINDGFMRRRALIARSRVVDLMGRIHADNFFSRSIHAQRSEYKDQTDSQQGRILFDSRRAIRSQNCGGRIDCTQSQTVAVRFSSSCQSTGTRHSKISYKTGRL